MGTLKPGDRDVTLCAMIIDLVMSIDLKDGTPITQFNVADHTGSIWMNFFGPLGE